MRKCSIKHICTLLPAPDPKSDRQFDPMIYLLGYVYHSVVGYSTIINVITIFLSIWWKNLKNQSRYYDVDRLMQERRNSKSNALEFRLSSTSPSICYFCVFNGPWLMQRTPIIMHMGRVFTVFYFHLVLIFFYAQLIVFQEGEFQQHAPSQCRQIEICVEVSSKQIRSWRVKHCNTYPFATIYFYMREYGQDKHVSSNVICFSYGLRSRAKIWCYMSVCWFIILTFISVLVSHASIANRCPDIIISLINLTYILNRVAFISWRLES